MEMKGSLRKIYFDLDGSKNYQCLVSALNRFPLATPVNTADAPRLGQGI